MLKKASSSEIKIEPEIKKHSTFDPISFDDDTDEFWNENSKHLSILEDSYQNPGSFDTTKQMSIVNDDDQSSNLKCLIREDILAKAKSANSSPQRLNSDKYFTLYQNPSERKTHLLNVLELMGGNDIPLEEKHQKLPRGHDREFDLNDPDYIADMRISKQMKAFFDEQGIDAPSFLDNPIPQGRPPSREESKSLYD